MAKVIKRFKGVPDGAIQPKVFEEGDQVTGQLADVAIAEGWAESDKSSKSGGAVEEKRQSLLDQAKSLGLKPNANTGIAKLEAAIAEALAERRTALVAEAEGLELEVPEAATIDQLEALIAEAKKD